MADLNKTNQIGENKEVDKVWESKNKGNYSANIKDISWHGF